MRQEKEQKREGIEEIENLEERLQNARAVGSLDTPPDPVLSRAVSLFPLAYAKPATDSPLTTTPPSAWAHLARLVLDSFTLPATPAFARNAGKSDTREQLYSISASHNITKEVNLRLFQEPDGELPNHWYLVGQMDLMELEKGTAELIATLTSSQSPLSTPNTPNTYQASIEGRGEMHFALVQAGTYTLHILLPSGDKIIVTEVPVGETS